MFVAYVLITVWIELILVDSTRVSDVIPLKVGVHLFVDDQYLENVSSLEFQNGLIEKDTNHPIVYPEYPWEAAVYFYTSFLQVPSNISTTGKAMYIIYYGCFTSDKIIYSSEASVCVANSTDGIVWEKPLLWYYPYKSNETEPDQPTNIIFITEINEFLGSIFIDTHPDTPRSELFKMTYENEPVRYVYIATSPDGFNWTAGKKAANPTAGLADTQTVMMYSPENGGQYVLYGRLDWNLPNSTVYCPGATPAFRRVMGTVSSNGTYGPWSEPIEVFPLGSPDPLQCFDNYNPATLYYKDVYFLFPSAFHHWSSSDSGAPIPLARLYEGVMDIRLAVSRTALGPFIFPSRDPFISRGIGTMDPLCKIVNGTGSDRDAGFVFASVNGLLDPDFIDPSITEDSPSPWVYHIYWGSQTTHGCGAILGRYWPGAYSGIFKARLRREGYVTLSTLSSNPTGYGSFVTKILLLPSNDNAFTGNNTQLELRINAQIATSGYLTVQFEDALNGNPIPGYTFQQCKPLHENGIRQLLQWKTTNDTNYRSDLTPLVNYPGGIRIHFQMAHTKLYSWLLSYVH